MDHLAFKGGTCLRKIVFDLEQQLVGDARSGWNELLVERLRAEIRAIRGT